MKYRFNLKSWQIFEEPKIILDSKKDSLEITVVGKETYPAKKFLEAHDEGVKQGIMKPLSKRLLNKIEKLAIAEEL